MAPVTAIEFTDLECKVLQVERGKGGRPVARVMLVFPLPQKEDLEERVSARAQVLRDMMKHARLAPSRVRVIIPKHYVQSRKVTLPSTVDEELAGMVRFEAEKHIPFNAERHVVDYHVLSRQGMQGSEVLLAAVDQPAAQEFLDVCLRAGFNVETLDVSTFALHRAFSLNTPPAAEGQGNVVAVLNIGLATTEIVIVQDGKLAYSRSAPVSLAKLLDDAGEADPESGFHIRRLADIDALEPEGQPGMPAAPAKTAAVPPPPAPADSHDDDLDGPEAQPGPAGAGLVPSVPSPPAAGHGASASHTETLVVPLTEPVHVPPPPPPADAPVPHQGNGTSVSATDPHVPQFAPQALSASVLRLLYSNWQLRLLREIRTTYEFARREFNCPPISHFHVCGEGALIRNLPQLLSNNFGVGASVFDPFQNVEVPAKVEQVLKERRPAHAALVGGAVPDAPNAVQVNLLPSQYVEEKRGKRQQQSYMVTGILALTALVLAYVWLDGLLTGQTDRLQELQRVNQEMKADVQDLQEKMKRNEIVNRYIRDRRGAVEVLDTLSSDTLFAFIPKNVSMKSFEYTKGETLKVTGWAMTLQDANRFRQALENTGYFEVVKENEGHLRQTPLPSRSRQTLVYEVNLEGQFPKQKKKSSSSSSKASKEEE